MAVSAEDDEFGAECAKNQRRLESEDWARLTEFLQCPTLDGKLDQSNPQTSSNTPQDSHTLLADHRDSLTSAIQPRASVNSVAEPRDSLISATEPSHPLTSTAQLSAAKPLDSLLGVAGQREVFTNATSERVDTRTMSAAVPSPRTSSTPSPPKSPHSEPLDAGKGLQSDVCEPCPRTSTPPSSNYERIALLDRALGSFTSPKPPANLQSDLLVFRHIVEDSPPADIDVAELELYSSSASPAPTVEAQEDTLDALILPPVSSPPLRTRMSSPAKSAFVLEEDMLEPMRLPPPPKLESVATAQPRTLMVGRSLLDLEREELSTEPIAEGPSEENDPNSEKVAEPEKGQDVPHAKAGKVPTLQSYLKEEMIRPTAEGASESDLETHDKVTIFVLHKGIVTAVSWMKDVATRDVRDAVLCACDAIAEEGFLLRELRPVSDSTLAEMVAAGEAGLGGKLIEVEQDGEQVYYLRGRIFEFEAFCELGDGRLYLVEKGNERLELQAITGDRYRRLALPLDPLRHVEAQKGIVRMRVGTNLLKYTSLGFPHLRFFQLSADLKRLVWYSSSKSKERSVINLQSVKEIRIGLEKCHENFKNVQLLQRFSFTICADQVLSLAAKDENEFNLWVTGLKALACWTRNRPINKIQLLSHCQKFREAILRNDVTQASLGTNDNKIDLASIATPAPKPKAEIVVKLERLRSTLRRLEERIASPDVQNIIKSKIQERDKEEGIQDPDDELAVVPVDLTDEEMEYVKISDLMATCKELLEKSATALKGLATQSTPESKTLGEVNRQLWLAEIDIENIEDILKRLTSRPTVAFQKRLSGLNEVVVEDLKRLKAQIQTWIPKGVSLMPFIVSGVDPPPG